MKYEVILEVKYFKLCNFERKEEHELQENEEEQK